MNTKYRIHAVLLLAMSLFVVACDKQQPDFFDASANGVYFDYASSSELQQSINFADYILGNPTSLPVSVRLKILGYIDGDNRKAYVKTRPVDGYPEAMVVIPDIDFSDGEYLKNIEIAVERPAERDVEYAVCIYIDDEVPGSLGAGIEGRNEFTIFVKEQYTQPIGWSDTDWAVGYLGSWTPDKHIFFVNLLNNNDFALNGTLYDWGMLVQYNTLAVEEIRRLNQENPSEPVAIEIPFNSDCQYSKPYYWQQLHDKYIGEYSASVFSTLASAVGANTTNEAELLSGNEERLISLNKMAVKTMMQNYNMYYSSWSMSSTQFKQNCWFPMFDTIEYELVQPDCWSDFGVGAGVKVKAYYGEYSDEKYSFMIKAWLKKQNAEGKDFVLWQMFPLIIDWSIFDAAWDEAAGGEEAIKECYKVFKAHYDEAPAGTYNFTFPELDI